MRAPARPIALVGEYGAGKSTFLGVIAGRVVPTRGGVRIFGQPHVFGEPRQARRLGIATIYQELTIVPALSAQANVFLGQPLSQAGLLDERGMRRRFEELAGQMAVSIRPDAVAGRLSVADQQMLEIMRGVQSGARLILFDEPTTSLAPPERAALFGLMRQLRSQGTTMMFVSHNLEEVLDISDMVTVFRDGNLSGSAPRSDWTKPSLIRAMVGHDVVEYRRLGRAAVPRGGVPLLAANHQVASKARSVAREFGFAENRIGTIMRNLSGGNQQKVLLGKARFREPKILLVDEPTRGIDVGAKDEIMSTLRRLADAGLGIIVVSSDLEEVIAASDRIIVMSEGLSVAELDQGDAPATVQDILNAAFKVMTHE